MSRLLAAMFTDLESHTLQWTRTPNAPMVKLLSEYRHLAEGLASQHGSLHRNFTGDGHLFLFENPDAAIQFGFRLLKGWSRGTPFAASQEVNIPMRVGCHFGECVSLENDAKQRYEEALGLRQDYPEAHHALANLLKSRSDLQGAIHHYQEALRLRPVYPEAHNNFAIALEDIGEMQKAEEHYREALQQCPTYKEAHYNYALLLEALGRVAEAQQHYEGHSGSGLTTPKPATISLSCYT